MKLLVILMALSLNQKMFIYLKYIKQVPKISDDCLIQIKKIISILQVYSNVLSIEADMQISSSQDLDV